MNDMKYRLACVAGVPLLGVVVIGVSFGLGLGNFCPLIALAKGVHLVESGIPEPYLTDDNISGTTPESVFAFLLKYSCGKLHTDHQLSLENNSPAPRVTVLCRFTASSGAATDTR